MRGTVSALFALSAVAVAAGGLAAACDASTFRGSGGGDGAATDDATDVVIVIPERDGGNEAASDATTGAQDGTAPTDGAAGDAEAGPVPVTISGQVVAEGEYGWTAIPLPSRTISLVDSTGRVFTTTADSGGAFQIPGVLPPYDAMVVPVDAALPQLFMGLSATQIRLAAPSSAAPQTATVTATVQFGDCGGSSCPCKETFFLPEAQLSQDDYPQVGTGNLTWAVSTPIRWTGPTTTVTDYRVLEWDPQGQHYWFASKTGISLTSGQTVDLGELDLVALPNVGTMTITTPATGVPANWGAAPTYGLYYPPNEFFAYELPGSLPAPYTTVTVTVPDLPDAEVYAASLGSQEQSSNGESILSRSGFDVPLTTTTATAPFVAPPTIVTPPLVGSVSSIGTVRWQGGPAGELYEVAFYSADDAGNDLGKGEATIYTSGTEIDLGRAAALGVHLTLGASGLYLYGFGQVASLNAMVDQQTKAYPDGSSIIDVQWPFTVTP